jgi:hypothetical protein
VDYSLNLRSQPDERANDVSTSSYYAAVVDGKAEPQHHAIVDYNIASRLVFLLAVGANCVVIAQAEMSLVCAVVILSHGHAHTQVEHCRDTKKNCHYLRYVAVVDT